MIIKSLSKSIKKKREGVYFSSITRDNAQLVYIELAPGSKTFHYHPNEQMGYILSGKVEITINGETKVCGPGDAYLIPANAEHGFNVLGDTLSYLEVFCPVKEENK